MKKMIVLTLFIAGCVAVPVMDSAGEPMMNPDGTPMTEMVFSPTAAEGAGAAVAPFLPPPFGLAVPLIGALATMLMNKKD